MGRWKVRIWKKAQIRPDPKICTYSGNALQNSVMYAKFFQKLKKTKNVQVVSRNVGCIKEEE